MSKYRVSQGRIRHAAEHCRLDHRHHFACFRAERGEAQDSIVGADQSLHESACLGQCARAQHQCHGEPGDAVGDALCLGLDLVHADVGQLRIGEQAIGDEAAVRGTPATGEVVMDNAKIVEADVRELRTAGAIAHCPDIGSASLELLVDANVAARIQINGCFGQVQPIRVRRSAGRHEDVGGFESSLGNPRAHLEFHAYARTARDIDQLRLQQNLDALILHQSQ